jgi:hypothetical protein
MPRKTSTLIPDVTGPQLTPLDAIPQDVKNYVEEVYERQRKTPGRERAEYDTVDELKNEFKLMADYVAQRPKGVLRIRKSPTRDLPETTMDFRITADIEANGKANGQSGAKAEKTSSAAK